MRLFFFCIGIQLTTVAVPILLCAQPNELLQEYQEAEALYNTPNPTPKSDSTALAKYLWVANQLQHTNQQPHLLINSYERAGVIQQINNNNKKAVNLYQNAISVADNHSLSDSLVYHSYLYSGNAYYQINALDSALHYLKRAEEILQKYSLGEADRLYNSFGSIYYEAGNYQQSINYFSKALQVLNEQQIQDQEAVYSFTSNIATALGLLNQYDSAVLLYKSLIPLGTQLDQIYLNLGAAYIDQQQPDSALVYLQRVQDSTLSQTIILHNSLARAFLQKNQPELAIDQLRATEVDTLAESGNNRHLGSRYQLLGDALFRQQRYSEALSYYQSAIIQFDYDFNDTTVLSNPRDFSAAFSNFSLFGSLTSKARCLELLYKKNQSRQYLNAVIDTYQSAFRMADYVNKWFDNQEARLFLSDQVFPAYQSAVTFAIERYEQHQDQAHLLLAFRWAEQSKANALSAAIQDSNIKSFIDLPDSLLRREQGLRHELSRLFILVDQENNSQRLVQLETQIRDTELALSRLQDRLNEYPNYYQQKFAYDSLNVREIQQNILSPQLALLAYFYTDSLLYGFALTQDQLTYSSTPRNKEHDRNLRQLLNQLRTIVPGKAFPAKNAATKLYEELIKPHTKTLKGVQSLLIIPHQTLSYLPFEALLNEQQQYLIQEFSISYQHASSFLRTRSATTSDLGEALALVPFSESVAGIDEKFTTLRASTKETSPLNGVTLESSEATKANFVRYSTDASIVHLATHATANSEDPSRSFIAFYPSTPDESSYKLFAHELYNLSLKDTQLAFLSACETADGKMVNGEGIMSLSRAFAYAGCPNLITSLWKAEDYATAYLSKQFYHYLSQEQNVAASLRQAKLDLLTNPEFSQFKSPTYWSHLIFVGTPSPGLKTRQLYWVLLPLLILLGGLGWLQYRRRIRKTGS